MGYATYDIPRAIEELKSLLAAQWDNGFLAHITFNPSDKNYFPGSSFWETEKYCKNKLLTSGLIQPPLLAISIHFIEDLLLAKKEDTSVLNSFIEQTIKYHYFLKENRDPEDYGLISIIHPWESGTDNSPRWDSILEKIPLSTIPKQIIETVQKNRTDSKLGDIQNRPLPEDYYRYIYLISLYKDLSWDNKKILSSTPFVVKDTLVNAIWAKANTALGTLLQKRGREKEAVIFLQWAKQTHDALQKSWNKEKKLYALYNASEKKLEPFFEDTIATFLPFYSHAATGKQISNLLAKLIDPTSYWTKNPIPSTPLSNPHFEKARYWRGPTWPITNLFLIEGLKSYAENEKCQKLWKDLYRKTLSMIEKIGFCEYYDPLDEQIEGMGFGNFSWSAAIYLYLTATYAT